MGICFYSEFGCVCHASLPTPCACLPALCCVSPSLSLFVSNEACLRLSSLHCRRKTYCSSSCLPYPMGPSHSSTSISHYCQCFFSTSRWTSDDFFPFLSCSSTLKHKVNELSVKSMVCLGQRSHDDCVRVWLKGD